MYNKAFKQGKQRAIAMCLLGALFYYYEYYLRVAPSVMNLELTQFFNLGEAQFGMLAACYYYAYTPMQLPVGMMMDRFGPRRILTLACLLCASGTYLFAATSHLFLAQVGRFIVGFGSAFAYVGVLKISNLWLPKKYFAFIAGVCSTLGMFGAISGQMIMTRSVEAMGWQSTLYYAGGFGIILTVILWCVLRDGSTEHHPPLSVDSLKDIFLSSALWINGLIGCLTFIPISGFAEVWAVSFLENAGMTRYEAAIGSSMLFLGFAIGGPCWGIFSDWIKSRRIPLMLGSFVAAILMGLVVFLPRPSVGWMYPLLFFSAFFSSAEILIFAVSNDLSKPHMSATAAAFSNMVVMIGGILLPITIGTILDKSIQHSGDTPLAIVHDYSVALGVLPLCLILAGVLSMMLKETYHQHT